MLPISDVIEAAGVESFIFVVVGAGVGASISVVIEAAGVEGFIFVVVGAGVGASISVVVGTGVRLSAFVVGAGVGASISVVVGAGVGMSASPNTQPQAPVSTLAHTAFSGATQALELV